MKKIIFRADGNSTTGLGHLYRIFALIEMYKDNFHFVLLTKETSTLSVIPTNYSYKLIPETISIEEEPTWLNENYPSTNHQIIADGYHFNSTYQKALKQFNYKLIYVDDLTTEYMYANVVINHSLAVNSTDYKAEIYTQFALGTSYAILRPLFIEEAKREREIKTIDTAFVCFGGADQFDLTCRATKALLNLKEIKKINVVVGGAYLHTEIIDLEKKYERLNVFQNLSENELVNVMQESNFGIVSASNILYELCTVKMPIFSGYYVENQKNIYKGCLENECIYGGGNLENYSVGDFEEKIKEILNEPNYEKYIIAQSKLFDGEIKNRFLALLSPIQYRKANESDIILLYNWSNEKLTRSNSYYSDPITLETHQAWFEKKLNDKNSIIYIASIENKPAGMIRYQIEENNSVVGVIVSEEFRGKGLATHFLSDTAKFYFKENTLPIFAYIKKENIASMKSFENASYKKLKEELVHEYKSVVYKLEKNVV